MGMGVRRLLQGSKQSEVHRARGGEEKSALSRCGETEGGGEQKH